MHIDDAGVFPDFAAALRQGMTEQEVALIVKIEDRRRVGAVIPGARVDVIPGSGHFPWVDRPAAFRAAVERLLR